MQWRGPFRVVETVSTHDFKIKHLICGKQIRLYVSRLNWYHDATLNVTEKIKRYTASQGEQPNIKDILPIKQYTVSKMFLVEVSWLKFEKCENKFEPFGILGGMFLFY